MFSHETTVDTYPESAKREGTIDLMSDVAYLRHVLLYTVQTLKRALESPLPRGCKHSFSSEFVLSCVLTGLVAGQYLMCANRPEKCEKPEDRIDLHYHSVLFKWKLKEKVDFNCNPVAGTYLFN
jgi:hypothetical protein